MSSSQNEKNRIPSELISNSDQVVSWSLPNVDVKKERLFRSANKEKDAYENDEIIEDYNGKVKPKSLTAEQLKKITDDAHEEGFNQGREAGFEKGFEEGLNEGTKQGKDKAFNEFRDQLVDEQMRLKTIADALLNPMLDQDKKIENIILDIAIRLTQELLHTEIEQFPHKIVNVIHHTLDALPIGSKNITVYLSQKDADLIEGFLPKTQRNWSVKINDKIKPGGCQVQSDESFIDYTVEARLDKYFKEIKQKQSTELHTLEDVPNHFDKITERDDTLDLDEVSSLEKMIKTENPESIPKSKHSNLEEPE